MPLAAAAGYTFDLLLQGLLLNVKPANFQAPAEQGFGGDTQGGEAQGSDPLDLQHKGWLYLLLIPVVLLIFGILYLFLGPGSDAHHHAGFLFWGVTTENEMMIAAIVLGVATIGLIFLESQRKEEQKSLVLQRNLALSVIVFCIASCVFLYTSYTGLSGSEEAFYYTTDKMYFLKLTGLGFIVLLTTLAVLLFVHWHRFARDGVGLGLPIGPPVGMQPPPQQPMQPRKPDRGTGGSCPITLGR